MIVDVSPGVFPHAYTIAYAGSCRITKHVRDCEVQQDPAIWSSRLGTQTLFLLSFRILLVDVTTQRGRKALHPKFKELVEHEELAEYSKTQA